jgi:hypothetical protein
MYKERARGTPALPFKRFKGTPMVFFHVHGPADIVIHSVHAQRIAEPQPVADLTGPDDKQTLSPLPPVVRPTATPAKPDTIGQALAVLAQGLSNVHNINYLMRAWREAELQERQKLQTDFLQRKEEAANIADRAKATFRGRFAEAPPLAPTEWRVAVPQQPLLTETPQGIGVRQEEGKTVIRKETVRAACHICLDYPLIEETQLKIRFSLPVREQRNGAPIAPTGTMLGLRDEGGQQQGLFSFPATSPPDEIHEILVDRHGELYTAMYKEQAQGSGANRPTFTSPPLIFFSISGPGEVVIHSVHAQRAK